MDGLNQVLDAAQVYERLMDSQEVFTMRTHVLAFLRTCMIGNWRNHDEKPVIAAATNFSLLPGEARLWGAMQFNRLLTGLPQATAIVKPPCQGPQGVVGAPEGNPIAAAGKRGVSSSVWQHYSTYVRVRQRREQAKHTSRQTRMMEPWEKARML